MMTITVQDTINQGDTMTETHSHDDHTDGVAAVPIIHERPAQRSAVVNIEGLPVGWAKITVGSAEKGAVRVSQIVIHENHIEEDSNFFFGMSDDDETPQVNVPAPITPGFYRYIEGRQLMLFLLKDNRETNAFFDTQGIDADARENDWQWYVILDNGTSEKCEWGYIEQALVNDNKLVLVA